ncbi:hypothetical protein GGI42DRAFT_188175 [Trichoderma sp. SZMC 28013]
MSMSIRLTGHKEPGPWRKYSDLRNKPIEAVCLGKILERGFARTFFAEAQFGLPPDFPSYLYYCLYYSAGFVLYCTCTCSSYSVLAPSVHLSFFAHPSASESPHNFQLPTSPPPFKILNTIETVELQSVSSAALFSLSASSPLVSTANRGPSGGFQSPN